MSHRFRERETRRERREREIRELETDLGMRKPQRPPQGGAGVSHAKGGELR